MKPLVTVIIPCYNVEKYVAKAIESILQQTYRILEILIVDDASTDSTLEIIKCYQDPRIRIIPLKENTRKIGAVNTVIHMATGQYVAFQDSDDWSEPTRIARQVQYLTDNPELGMCFTHFDFRSESGKLINDSGKLRNTDQLIRKEFFEFYNDSNSAIYKPSQCSTLLVKAEILKHEIGYHPYFAGKVAEDVHLVYRMLKRTKAGAIPDTLYHFMRLSDSLTGKQLSGQNSKAAYTWPLLSLIIEYDQKGIEVLDGKNADLLRKLELEACEKALVNTIREKNALQLAYETSATYRLGKLLLSPIQQLKKLFSR